MEMRHNRWMMASLLGGAMLLVAGCAKEKADGTGGEPGSPIVFSAAASYENGDATRTEYSGVIYGTTNRVERIDWLKDVDKFTVNYVHGTTTDPADFLVTSVAADNYNSNAGVDAVGDVLRWADGTDHAFYAMYPTHTVNSSASLTGNHFQATLNPAQNQTHQQDVTVGDNTWKRWLPDMNYAYMVAYAGSTYGISGNSVTLPFRPAVTTFEFRLRRQTGAEGANVRKFQLISEGHALTGQYSFDITGGDARGATWGTVTVPDKTAENSVITVDFGTSGVALPDVSDNKYLDFTVFALPVDLADLSIKLIYTDGSSRLMPLKDKNADGTWANYHEFLGAKKYVFTNSHVPGDEWEYFLDPIEDIIKYGHTAFSEGFTVHSYRTKGSVTEPVSWAVQYSTDGTNWSNTSPAGSNASVSTGSSPTAGYSAGHNNTTTSTIDQTGHTDILKNNTVTSSATAPYDLSMHTVQGGARSGPVTANSYIIKAPGYYMFPLVYGNSIDATHNTSIDANAVNGGNKDSYAPTKAANSKTYLTPFLNVKDQGIRYPNILKDLGIEGTGVDAVIVWQDVPSGFEIIQETSLEIIDAPANAGVKNCKYIKFQIEKARITQGNILIALRDASDQIVWSWHIWVTDESMALIPLKNQANDWTNVMPVDVGWCDIDVTRVTKYADRDFYVRVYQTGEGTKETTFHVIQYGESTSVNAKGGSSTYYQWGRKDPFLPSNGNRGSIANKNYVAPHYTITKSDIAVPAVSASTTGSLSAKRGISNPYTMYYYSSAEKHISVVWIGIDGNEYSMTGTVFDYSKFSPLDWFDGAVGGYYHENLWDTACTGPWYDPDNRYPEYINSAYPNSRTTARKSVYDPCPPGFRVPTASEFDILTNKALSIPASAQYVAATMHFEVYCNGVNNANGVIVVPWQSYRQASGQDAYGEDLETGGISGLGVFHIPTSTPYINVPKEPNAPFGDDLGFADATFGIDYYGNQGMTFVYFPIMTYPGCGAYPVRPVAE